MQRQVSPTAAPEPLEDVFDFIDLNSGRDVAIPLWDEKKQSTSLPPVFSLAPPKCQKGISPPRASLELFRGKRNYFSGV